MTSQLLTEHNSNAMCKKPAFLVSLISLITIATLCLLVAFAKLPNSHRNGFTRIFSKNNITPLRRSISKAPYIGFGGTSSTNIFLAVPNPQWLVMLDKNLGKQTNYHIPVPKTDQYSLHSFFVDSPNVFLFANNVPAVVYGTLNGTLTETVKLSTSPFTRCAYISPHSIVIRSFDSTSQNPVFQKVEIQTGRIQKQVGLFKASGDFGLSTDGFLLYDSLTRSIIYVEYFTNKVVCIDTNLNLPHASQTIDTTNYNAVTIKDVKFEDGNRLMPVTARTTINSDGCVFKGVLFVHSELKADNETANNYANNAVIDRYDIKTGKYLGSFYVPNLNHEKLSSFLIQEGLLVALYKTQLETFEIMF